MYVFQRQDLSERSLVGWFAPSFFPPPPVELTGEEGRFFFFFGSDGEKGGEKNRMHFDTARVWLGFQIKRRWVGPVGGSGAGRLTGQPCGGASVVFHRRLCRSWGGCLVLPFTIFQCGLGCTFLCHPYRRRRRRRCHDWFRRSLCHKRCDCDDFFFFLSLSSIIPVGGSSSIGRCGRTWMV